MLIDFALFEEEAYLLSGNEHKIRLVQRKQCDDISQVPRIVYWFGSNKLENAFSILEGKACITYQRGMEMGLKEKICMTKDGRQKYKLMKTANSKPVHSRRSFPKLREEYEYVIGPMADRHLFDIEAEYRQRGLLEGERPV